MGDGDLTYSEALAELEDLVLALDRDEVDVDELTEKVRRASELVQFCRERIQNAKAEITEAVAAFDDEAAQVGLFEAGEQPDVEAGGDSA